MTNLNELPKTKLRELRNKRRLTQADLAKMIGKKRSVITRYESGKIDMTIGTLGEIAKALNVSIKFFFTK